MVMSPSPALAGLAVVTGEKSDEWNTTGPVPGVNPSAETIRNWHTRRSLDFPSQTTSSPLESSSAGEAEASAAGEQLAEE